MRFPPALTLLEALVRTLEGWLGDDPVPPEAVGANPGSAPLAPRDPIFAWS
jgi:hypothetical protein